MNKKSIIKEFNKKLSSILGGYLVLDSIARNGIIPHKNAMDLREKMFDELDAFLSSSLDKAFTAGVAEGKNEEYERGFEDARKETRLLQKIIINDKDKLNEEYHEGYKQGIADEINCVETNGEHFDLRAKLSKLKELTTLVTFNVYVDEKGKWHKITYFSDKVLATYKQHLIERIEEMKLDR